MLADTHAHLSMSPLLEDVENVLDRAKKAGVKKVVLVGADPVRNRLNVELAKKFDLPYAVGFHPTEEGGDYAELFAQLENANALGEVGLDFFHNPDHKEQYSKFEKQLEMAEKLNLPVCLHARESAKETLAVVKKYQIKKAVFHCYTDSLETAEKILAEGFLISLGGIVTYPKALAVQELAKKIPLKQMMLETDWPYLAPESRRGQVCEPSDILEIAKKIAEIKNVSLEEVAKITTQNADEFFVIK